MTPYQQFLQKLYKMSPSREKRPLDTMLFLRSQLSFPDRSFPSIHVAGTNGKGSVATKIAAALTLSGYRTGLYLSPHVSSFRERISIDGKMISEEEVVLGMQKVTHLANAHHLSPSFFEIITLLCLDYFAKKKVDVAVLEAGLGGQWDATNVITPLLSVIVSVRIDHRELLGDTLEKIGKEKAGILKKGVPVILGPKAKTNSILQKAKELSCPYFFVSQKGRFFDEENNFVAKKALEQLSSHFSLKEEAIAHGLQKRPKCRLEVFNQRSSLAKSFPHFPECIIFDVAHNPDGFRSLKKSVRHFFPRKKFRVVCGMSKDKDIDGCMKILSSFAAHIHLVKTDHFRLAAQAELFASLQSLGFQEMTMENQLEEALQKALLLAIEKKEILLFCGSFFIMREARKALQIEEERDE